MQRLRTTCCVVGGGPAGMILGYLLARAGVPVTVLEKHKDFFRDFRGDTVHPSTLGLIYQLGLLDDFLAIPHQELGSIGAKIGDFAFRAADFRHLPTHSKFIALMPQWDLLDFFAKRAQEFPSFQLLREHEAVGLLQSAAKVTGVVARTRAGEIEIDAELVVGCDGRHSITRQAAQLKLLEFGVPIDVLWFRISRNRDDPEEQLGNVNYGKALILINRGDYFQAGLIIAKGSFEEIKRKGLEEFKGQIRSIVPYLGNRVDELTGWEQINLLTVQINRLQKWHRPGLICIGDAAHAMSPAGGVGINLAIQDAVATANLLAGPFGDGKITESLLEEIQKRREFPAKVTQALQVRAHGMLARVFKNPGPATAPWQFRLAVRLPGLQRILGRLVGMGVRPERIRTRCL